MNRRDFCLTAGLLATTPLIGGLCCSAAGAITQRNNPASFRAKKVYLDSWAAGIACGDASRAMSFVRQQWHELRSDNCNAVILVPGRHSRAGWLKLVETEANRLGLAVFVPTRLTRDFFRDAATVVPLTHEKGRLQSQVTWATDNGGLLLVNQSNGIHGLVLYDASRCLWTGYATSGVACVTDSKCQDDASKLTVAQWLDHTKKSLSELLKRHVI